MPDALIEIGETCGMEIECDRLPRSIKLGGFRSVHDASCETDYLELIPKIQVEKEKGNPIFERLAYGNVTLGTELTSEIMKSSGDNFLHRIKSVTKYLSENGEEPTSKRSGIHFHFSMSNPSLRMLKSLLRLGRFLETVFFSVGGMGYSFRGIENDATYCRPITKFGPPCVPSKGGYVQCFNISDVLKVKSVEDFWRRYGDLYNHAGRYNPVRYSWLNLYPLFPGCRDTTTGTVEIRVFNRTLNPLFIHAAAMLCKYFVNYSLGVGFNELKEERLLKENSIYSGQDIYEVIHTLEKFAEIVEMESEVFDTLVHIINLSGVPKLENKYVYSHLMFSRGGINPYWVESSYMPEMINKSKIYKPNYVDIHVLRSG